ncbi:MAG: thymidine phosphorylase [Alphaproteobacteria bacterium]|nr:thymidine phosphorylase [Alphaproteobacteria bacterium]
MLPQEIIRKKRDKNVLSKEEIREFIKGVASDNISEGQIAAFTMAVLLNGMEPKETAALTRSMTNTGVVIDWSNKNLNGAVLDKHSTGGVGDKVSLMLAPMIAACGAYVPMIAGRGLGHTGGTLDKLEAIPGYNVDSGMDVFVRTVKDVGCAIIGQTVDLAPADKRIYAIRDVTATVESIPLITASILSKKLAAGLEGLVMDLKVGNGAFMETPDDARALATSIVSVAKEAGVKASALVTDMNQILGRAAGNAVEVREAIDYLRGDYRDARIHETVMALCSEMLVIGGVCGGYEDANSKLQASLDSGKALELFARMVDCLGGDASVVDKPDAVLPKAPVIRPIFAEKEGVIAEMNTRDVGLAIISLGGGRTNPSQAINSAVGFFEFADVGESVDTSSKPIAVVHAASETDADRAENQIQKAVKVRSGGGASVGSDMVLERID